MAVRTTAANVQKIVETDSTIWDDIFMTDASILVDRLVLCAAGKGITLTASELELIERYLAAHGYALRDRQLKQHRNLNSSGQFDGNTDMGLDATLFGQHAKRLDHSGCLAAFDEGHHSLSIWWLGDSTRYTTTS